MPGFRGESSQHRRRFIKRPRRWLGWGAALLIVLILVGELVAREGLGLGDPPLYEPHERIGYLNVPGEYERFGNHVAYNRYGMRSGDLGVRRVHPAELRILMIGDSVIHGGALTDQRDIAATRLQRRLSERFDAPVRVGNACAGGWSPVNMLAYVREFGFFDADVVVIVLSSHDYAGHPPAMPENVNFPESAPTSALVEGMVRYVPKVWRRAVRMVNAPPEPTTAAEHAIDRPDDAQIERATEATREMIERARRSGARVIVALHMTRTELAGEPMPGHAVLRRIADEAGVEVVLLGDAFQQALEAGQAPYRDDIHPNPLGQQLVAETLEPRLRPLLHAALADRTVTALGEADRRQPAPRNPTGG